MPTIADATAVLSAAALPVLFADTCSLVDVIRAPMRPEKLSGCVKAAIDLRSLLSTKPAKCMLVAPSYISEEWHDHAEPTANLLRKHFQLQDAYAASFHEACDLLGMVAPFAQASYGVLDIANELCLLSEGLLQSAIHLDPQDDVNMRAYHRARKCIPPSKKGGEVKDCTIVEECLEVCKILRTTGFQKELVFCTSNVDDYQDGPILHPILEADFTAIGLTFANNLPWAIHELMK